MEIWVVIAFETKDRKTNVDHISNENTFTIFYKVKKISYVPYYVNCIGWQKNPFSVRQNAFLGHNPHLLTN
jgi:hypothetical protein